ncbi:hypothetical protein [Xenorhabdus japonica]|nr:hypothetical protein [Xenorhabdus japonica]
MQPVDFSLVLILAAIEPEQARDNHQSTVSKVLAIEFHSISNARVKISSE